MDDDYIDFSDYNLESIDNLKNLHDNHIKLFGGKIDLYTCENLFLNNNKIKKLDLMLFNNLKVLDISNNFIEKIEYLPPNLVELNARSCQLNFIPSHDKLKILYCSLNQLSELSNYPNLKELDCESNKINFINTYTNLEELICSSNPIIKIENQPKLKILDCSDTNINEPPYSDSLEILHFSNTQIKKLDFLKNLKQIAFNNENVIFCPKYTLVSHIRCNGEINVIFMT
jgi:hypothetical protein